STNMSSDRHVTCPPPPPGAVAAATIWRNRIRRVTSTREIRCAPGSFNAPIIGWWLYPPSPTSTRTAGSLTGSYRSAAVLLQGLFRRHLTVLVQHPYRVQERACGLRRVCV